MKRIFSGEVFFALFLLSGAFKQSLNFPIDLTVLFLVLTSFSVIKRIYTQPKIYKYYILPIIVYTLFLSYALFSYYYSTGSELSQYKLIQLIALTTPSFIFPFILFKTKENILRFLMAIGFISLIMAISVLPSIGARGTEITFVGLNEGNYLFLSRATSMGFIIFSFIGIMTADTKLAKVAFTISTFIILMALLSSGARMPVIATGIALIFIIFSTFRIEKGSLKYPKIYNKMLLALLVFIPILTIVYKQGYFNSLLYRLNMLLSFTDGGNSAQARTDRFDTAISIWQNNPFFGVGIGRFGEYYGKGSFDYPHNLFLEILSELGIIGFIILTFLLCIVAVRLFKLSIIKDLRFNNIYLTVFLITIILFLNAMVSGDINSNRMLFTFLSISCILPVIFADEFKEDKTKDISI